MNIEFTLRHFRAPDNLREYAEKEMKRIEKYFDRIIACQMIITHENNSYIVDINLSMPKHRLNVKNTAANVNKSIDEAVDKMISRISKIKDKWNKRN